MAQEPISNKNFQSPLKFRFTFNRLKNVTYFVQKVNIPGLTLSSINLGTPNNKIKMQGDELNFDSLDITFALQEGMKDWYELYTWMRGITGPFNSGEHKKLRENKYPNIATPRNQASKRENLFDQAILSVLSSQSNEIMNVTFYEVFPISLTEVPFDVTLGANEAITMTASFAYDYYDVLYI